MTREQLLKILTTDVKGAMTYTEEHADGVVDAKFIRPDDIREALQTSVAVDRLNMVHGTIIRSLASQILCLLTLIPFEKRLEKVVETSRQLAASAIAYADEHLSFRK